MAKGKEFIKFCYNSSKIEEIDFIKKLKNVENKGIVQLSSFSDWGLNINPKSPKFGQIVPANFAFVPTITISIEMKDAQTLLEITESLDIEDFVNNLKEKFSSEKINIFILEQKEDQISIGINPENTSDIFSSPSEVLKSVIDLTGSDLESNYCKYFINNCLIIDGLEGFEGEKSKQEEARKELYEYIEEKISQKFIKKSVVECYQESFDFRPFFGEGLRKLPKYNPNNDHWDWDEIYINPGMDSEKFTSEGKEEGN